MRWACVPSPCWFCPLPARTCLLCHHCPRLPSPRCDPLHPPSRHRSEVTRHPDVQRGVLLWKPAAPQTAGPPDGLTWSRAPPHHRILSHTRRRGARRSLPTADEATPMPSPARLVSNTTDDTVTGEQGARGQVRHSRHQVVGSMTYRGSPGGAGTGPARPRVSQTRGRLRLSIC